MKTVYGKAMRTGRLPAGNTHAGGIFRMCDALDFEKLLAESAKVHGHLCPGQVLGVRMAMLGLRNIGVSDPKGADRKKLMVFVEIDRCATDAIQSVTGCTLGHRTLKFLDYGKMAATFVNLAGKKAVRVVAREDAREKAKRFFPDTGDKYEAQLKAYTIMPDEDLFGVSEVSVIIRPEDMPGRPLRRVRCEGCGEHVQDMREVHRGGKVFCRQCAADECDERYAPAPFVTRGNQGDGDVDYAGNAYGKGRRIG